MGYSFSFCHELSALPAKIFGSIIYVTGDCVRTVATAVAVREEWVNGISTVGAYFQSSSSSLWGSFLRLLGRQNFARLEWRCLCCRQCCCRLSLFHYDCVVQLRFCLHFVYRSPMEWTLKLTDRGGERHEKAEETTEMHTRSLLAIINACTISRSVLPKFVLHLGFQPIKFGHYLCTRFPACWIALCVLLGFPGYI